MGTPVLLPSMTIHSSPHFPQASCIPETYTSTCTIWRLECNNELTLSKSIIHISYYSTKQQQTILCKLAKHSVQWHITLDKANTTIIYHILQLQYILNYTHAEIKMIFFTAWPILITNVHQIIISSIFTTFWYLCKDLGSRWSGNKELQNIVLVHWWIFTFS